jgi:hypothetical protein
MNKWICRLIGHRLERFVGDVPWGDGRTATGSMICSRCWYLDEVLFDD